MVIAHALVAAHRGHNVIVLIDDGEGRQLAASVQKRLELLRNTGANVGSIGLISTLTVLEKAAGEDYLPSRQDMRKLYDRLRKLDDGLLPIERTGLLHLPCWNSPSLPDS